MSVVHVWFPLCCAAGLFHHLLSSEAMYLDASQLFELRVSLRVSFVSWHFGRGETPAACCATVANSAKADIIQLGPNRIQLGSKPRTQLDCNYKNLAFRCHPEFLLNDPVFVLTG
jgi:hypothetical protein